MIDDVGVVGGGDNGVLDPRWIGASIGRRQWHFHRRLLDRYGVVLGPSDFSGIVRQIRTGVAVRIRDYADGSAVYAVRVISVGVRVYVVSDGWNLITALEPRKRLDELAVRLKGDKP